MKSIDDEFRLFVHSKLKHSKTPHLYSVYNLFINRGDAGLASHSAGRCAPHRRPGAVSVPYHSLYAQHSHNHFLYFYRAIRTANLEATAKTVRPREKSFISAISQFQYPAHKKNMNDVRGQEMSENTVLSFLIFPKNRFFAICGKVKGSCKTAHNIKMCAFKRRTCRRKMFQF